MNEPKIIGSHDAAAILGMSVRSVQRKADTGQIPVIRKAVGHRKEYVFDADVIHQIAAENDRA